MPDNNKAFTRTVTDLNFTGPKPLLVKDPGVASASTNERNRLTRNIDLSGAEIETQRFTAIPNEGMVAIPEKEKLPELAPFMGPSYIGGVPTPAATYIVDDKPVSYTDYAKANYGRMITAAEYTHYENLKDVGDEIPTVLGKDKIFYPDYKNLDRDKFIVFNRGNPIYQGDQQLKFLNHSVFSRSELESIRSSAERFGVDPALMIAQRLMENVSFRSIGGRMGRDANTYSVQNYMLKRHGLERNLQDYFRSAGAPYVYKKDAEGNEYEDQQAAAIHIKNFNKKYREFYDELNSLKTEADRQGWFLSNVGLNSYNTGTEKEFGFNYAERARFAADQIRKTEGFKKFFGYAGTD